MVTPELLDFIRAQIEGGMTREELVEILLAQGGWNQDDIDEAYAQAFPVPAPVQSPTPSVAAVPPVESKQDVQPASASDTALEELHMLETLIPSTPKSTASISSESDTVDDIASTPDVSFLDTLPIDEAPIAKVFPVAHDVPSEPVSPVIDIDPLQMEEVSVPAASPVQEVKAAPVVHESVQATAVVTPTHDAHDDFLGIFHPGGNGVSASSGAPKQATTPATGEPIKSVNPSTSAGSSVKTPAPSESSRPSVIKSDVASVPLVGKSEIKPVTPASPVAKPAASPSVPTSTQTPAFKFDLAKIRSDGAGTGIAPSQSATASAPRSLGFAGILAPTDEQKASVRPSSDEVIAKGVLIGKRTMASDMLLRGMGTPPATAPGTATPPVTLTPAPEEEKRPPVVVLGGGVSQSQSPRADDLRKKNKTKRVLGIVVAAAFVILLLSGIAFAFMKFRGPDIAETFSTAMDQFFNASTFAYKGKGNVDFSLSTAADGVARDGTIKFDFAYGGVVQSDKNGFGDGTHRIKLTGALQSGTFSWPTDIESDIRVIGSALYFHLLSFPSTSDLDPSLFKTYWVKVDLSEIAKELSLSGVAAAQEGYGSFGGQSADTSFNAILRTYSPFVPSGSPTDEDLAGVSAYHFTLNTDEDKALEFVHALYRKYMGSELTLTDDQRLRLRDALKKVHIEVWIAKNGGAPLQLAIKADLDDDIVTMHVKGTADILIGLADLNKPAKAEAPTPILTLEELKVRMEDYKNIKTVRQNDRAKIDRVTTLIASLDEYAKAKRRYPLFLTDLYKEGTLATSTISESVLKEYFYAAYASSTTLTKVNRCVGGSQSCVFYHLGVNLNDPENPELENDQDIVSDIKGDDKHGCAGETDVACFDVGKLISPESPKTSSVPTPSSATTSSKGTKSAK